MIKEFGNLKTVLPDRRNPQLATATGSEGRTPELTALMLGRFYTASVTKSNTIYVTSRNALRLTSKPAAGRKLAQVQNCPRFEPTAPDSREKGTKQASGHAGFLTGFHRMVTVLPIWVCGTTGNEQWLELGRCPKGSK